MEKKYQVFVSSTFTDLKDEREAVLRAILELDQIPAGMELFPAANETAWRVIQRVIEASDYYVLVIGGRYGSVDNRGIGYTEKEYNHAVGIKKPVLPFLHRDPGSIPRARTETDQVAWQKLLDFRSMVEQRHTCDYWTSADQLKAKVIVALSSAIKHTPGVGWIRADRPREEDVARALVLHRRVKELEALLEQRQARDNLHFWHDYAGEFEADEMPDERDERDELFRQAAELCIQHQGGSTGLLQRRLRIGYGRAARLMDQLERAGVLGPPDGPNPRDVLIDFAQLEAVCGTE